MERVGIVQPAEDFRVAIDLDQGILADIPAVQRQKPGGINLSEIRYEDDAVSVANLKSFIDGRCLHFRFRHAGRTHLVDGDAAVRWRFRRLHREWRVLGEIEYPAHDGFAFFGGNFVERLAAANGDQHEQAPAHHRKASAEQFIDRGEIVGGLFGDESVDLDRQTEASAMASRFDSAIKCSGYGADRVMLLGAGAVEAKSEALNAMCF